MFPQTKFSLEIMAECESTNEELWKKRDQDFHGKAILALMQNAGVGRRGRSWWFGSGNLALSIGFRLLGNENLVPLFPFVAGIALAETVSASITDSNHIRLKWPNDLYLEGKKLAGILVQAKQQGSNTDVVLGLGVNLSSPPPEELASVPATSLSYYGETIAPEIFAKQFLKNLEKEIQRNRSFQDLERAWSSWAKIFTTKLQVAGEEEILQADKLLPTGELQVKTKSGVVRRLSSEEVSLRLL